MTHSILDYIDRLIRTNGFISNDAQIDMQFWTGYRIFIRDGLDDYNSVDDWKEDTGGFNDKRDRYNNYRWVTEYVYQSFSRGTDSICDAGLRSYDIGLSNKYGFLSPLSTEMEKENLFMYTYSGGNIWIPELVNMHRRRQGLKEVEIPLDLDHSLEYRFIDDTSRTAQIEAKRVSINEEEAGVLSMSEYQY